MPQRDAPSALPRLQPRTKVVGRVLQQELELRPVQRRLRGQVGMPYLEARGANERRDQQSRARARSS